jgi:NADH:ubiquinone oxidoreductase subunit 6 (subunit J)
MNSEWVLWLFEGIALGAAVMILFSRSVFHAGLNLLVVVLAIGVLFGLYGSEFLFISQIMIYGGGIVILILFATMVTAKSQPPVAGASVGSKLPLGIACFGVIFLMTIWIIAYQPRGVPFVIRSTDLGQKLILDYAFPLEVSGVLLLVSLIGAVLSSIQKPGEP